MSVPSAVPLAAGQGEDEADAASAEVRARFAHLLQPIKDLSKVWKIDVADELEQYIEEVAQQVLASPDGHVSQLNFAEAALLIQGSTAIYSRKVEMLYRLVYQALDVLAVKHRNGTDSSLSLEEESGAPAVPGQLGKRPGRTAESWNPAAIDELLTVDHLVKEGRNILLESNVPEGRHILSQQRLPLFLMRKETDRRQKESRISSCAVHSSGFYLLQDSDKRLLDDLVSSRIVAGVQPEDVEVNEPIVPPPPLLEVCELDERLRELMRGIPEDVTTTSEDPLPKTMFAEVPVESSFDQEPAATSAEADPWALLDEHLATGKDLPLEVGRSSKPLQFQHLRLRAEELPDLDCDQGFAALAGTHHPVERLFFAVARNLRPGVRCEAEKAGFGPAWFGLEDLFVEASARRRSAKAKACVASQAASGEHDGDGNDPCVDSFMVDAASDLDEAAHARHPADGTGSPELEAPATVLAASGGPEGDHQREVAELEGKILEAQQRYESVVRGHLERMQGSIVGIGTDQMQYPDLYANIQRWQSQIAPLLREAEVRPNFDICEYSTSLLKTLSEQVESEEVTDEAIPFDHLVRGCTRWEVCRRFMTCLLLTNRGNTAIVQNENNCVNAFGIRLLKAELDVASLRESVEAVPRANVVEQRARPLSGGQAALGSTETRPQPQQMVGKRLRRRALDEDDVPTVIRAIPTPLADHKRPGRKRRRFI